MADDLTLPTRTGHAEWGDNHAFGHSIARELVGRETYLGLIALSITRRRLSEAERGLLDDMAVAMTVADPRIWPLKLIRVVSSYTSDLSAFAAGELCQAGAPIGHHATARAAEFLVELSRELGNRFTEPGAVTEHIRSRLERGEPLTGMGSAFLRSADERIALLQERAEARGRAQLPYFRLFLEVQTALGQLGHAPPNAAPAFAALCLDLGLTPSQCGTLAAMLGSADFLGNAVEGAEQAPAVLRELPAVAITYQGPDTRRTPRAIAKKSAG
jgi:hypothetical protein